jgi:hypothetical protein
MDSQGILETAHRVARSSAGIRMDSRGILAMAHRAARSSAGSHRDKRGIPAMAHQVARSSVDKSAAQVVRNWDTPGSLAEAVSRRLPLMDK